MCKMSVDLHCALEYIGIALNLISGHIREVNSR